MTSYEIRWRETPGGDKWDGDYVTGRYYDSIAAAFAGLEDYVLAEPEYRAGEYGIGLVQYPSAVALLITFPVLDEGPEL